MNSWEWLALLTIFAALVNVGTAGYLWYCGLIGRRREKMQHDIVEMLYGRIVRLERTLASRSDTPKH